MSWLSELFGGGGEDPLAVQQRMEGQRRAEAAEAQRRWEAEQATQRGYFEQQMEALRALLTPPAPAGPSPEELRAQQREELRSGALTGLGNVFTPEFERGYVPGTLTDPLVASTYASERAKADEYLNRLLKRGVITQTGFTGGQAALEEQAPRVRTQLRGIGDLLLEQERSGLRDIAGRAREAASTLDIGQAFDPNVYGTEARQRATEFQGRLPDLFASQVSGDLFDVSGLGARAGAGQEAQNLPFDPAALAGVEPEETEEEKKRRTSTVF